MIKSQVEHDAIKKNTQLSLADFAEIPLAIISFIIFQITRVLMRGFVALINRVKKDKPATWRVISAEMVNKPMVLPVFMTKAPRWNPHAVIGTLGPVKIDTDVSINTIDANGSANNWSASIQRLNGFTAERLSANTSDSQMDWWGVKLLPEYYSIAMRYYAVTSNPVFPSVKLDNDEVIAAVSFSADVNQFYSELYQRSNGFYRLLNFYIYTLLRFRSWLPRAFVNKQFLPAADAGIRFSYGTIKSGETLLIQTEADLAQSYDVYLTIYDRASFPRQWEQLKTASTEKIVASNTGFYLVRLLLKPGKSHLDIDKTLMVECYD
ncbi:hypothetical protein MNBD_GAMMA23-1304 [hydrothermal vent metagenome]|uniref:Uncharacterized protein n=1 Tax=hydrothermal vent metagenome TaxID=652676 RepID=A0A3B0ZTB0_9ZZZZ